MTFDVATLVDFPVSSRINTWAIEQTRRLCTPFNLETTISWNIPGKTSMNRDFFEQFLPFPSISMPRLWSLQNLVPQCPPIGSPTWGKGKMKFQVNHHVELSFWKPGTSHQKGACPTGKTSSTQKKPMFFSCFSCRFLWKGKQHWIPIHPNHGSWYKS